MINQLTEYLTTNKINFEVSGRVFIIDKKEYQIIEDVDGILFDTQMNFLDYSISDNISNAIFKFGGLWYYCNYDELEFNDLLYLGKINTQKTTDTFLGVHGIFDILNGSREYKHWVKKAKFLGVKNLAICELNTLAGTMKFQTECIKNNIKPIIGMQVSVIDDADTSPHLINLYAKNKTGWDNLLKINKIINVDTLNTPISNKNILKHSKGLIVVYNANTLPYAQYKLKSRLSVKFGIGINTTNNKIKHLENLENLKLYINDINLAPVMLTDAYYLESNDNYTKTLLRNISKNDVRVKGDNQYFHNIEEFIDTYEGKLTDAIITDAIENSEDIGKLCKFNIEVGNRNLPKYKMTPKEFDNFRSNEDLFFYLIEQGLMKKVPAKNHKEYLERIDAEWEVISYGDVMDYFLILWDIVKWSKEQSILVGTGRGCFLPNHKVKMVDGNYKNIQDVNRGDVIWNYFYGKTVVENAFTYNVDEEIVELVFEGTTIKCTKDHKFLTKNRGWVEAANLTTEDNVVEVKNNIQLNRLSKIVGLTNEEYIDLVCGKVNYELALKYRLQGIKSNYHFHDYCGQCGYYYHKSIHKVSLNVKVNLCQKCMKSIVNKLPSTIKARSDGNKNSWNNSSIERREALSKRSLEYWSNVDNIKHSEKSNFNSGEIKTRFGIITFASLVELYYIIDIDLTEEVDSFKNYDLPPVKYSLQNDKTIRSYFPDFIVNGIVVEIKGRTKDKYKKLGKWDKIKSKLDAAEKYFNDFIYFMYDDLPIYRKSILNNYKIKFYNR